MSISTEDFVQYMKLKASADQASEDATEIISPAAFKKIQRLAKQVRKVRRLNRSPNPNRFAPTGRNVRAQLKKIHKHILHVDKVRKKNEAKLRKAVQTTNKDVSKNKAKNKLQDIRLKGQEGALDALMMHRLFTSMMPPKLNRLNLAIDLGPVSPDAVFDTEISSGGNPGSALFSGAPAIPSFVSDRPLRYGFWEPTSGVKIEFNEDNTRYVLKLDAEVQNSAYDATHDLLINMISGIWKNYKGATNNFFMPMLLQNMNKKSDKKEGESAGSNSKQSTDNNTALMMMLLSMNQKSKENELV